MKAKEVRAMSETELRQRLTELRGELTSVRMKSYRSPMEQPHRIGQMRRDVARILTVLRQQPGAV